MAGSRSDGSVKLLSVDEVAQPSKEMKIPTRKERCGSQSLTCCKWIVSKGPQGHL